MCFVFNERRELVQPRAKINDEKLNVTEKKDKIDSLFSSSLFIFFLSVTIVFYNAVDATRDELTSIQYSTKVYSNCYCCYCKCSIQVTKSNVLIVVHLLSSYWNAYRQTALNIKSKILTLFFSLLLLLLKFSVRQCIISIFT